MKIEAHKPRLGILGGTFDPPHVGHMLMAQFALEHLALDEVIFLPAGAPPHKDAQDITHAAHRLCMVTAATAAHPAFTVDPQELNREGQTYTIDTIEALQKRHPDADLLFLIGADSLSDLHLWMRIEELLTLCRFITFVRPDESMQRIEHGLGKLPQEWRAPLRADMLTGREMNISSTEIRQRVADSLPIRYLVPADVLAYIEANELYQT